MGTTPPQIPDQDKCWMVISDRSRIPRDVFDAIWNCAAVATDDEDLTPLSFDQIDKIVSQTLQARQLVIR